MSYLLMNMFGIAAIGFTLWWFLWDKRRRKPFTSTNNFIDILVKDGVYQPALIQISARKPATLRFLREDQTPCSEVVIFPTLNQNYFLPLNKVVEVILPPQSVGEIEFECSMKMYRGKILIE